MSKHTLVLVGNLVDECIARGAEFDSYAFVTSLTVCPRETIRVNYSANRSVCSPGGEVLMDACAQTLDVKQTPVMPRPPECGTFWYSFTHSLHCLPCFDYF